MIIELRRICLKKPSEKRKLGEDIVKDEPKDKIRKWLRASMGLSGKCSIITYFRFSDPKYQKISVKFLKAVTV